MNRVPFFRSTYREVSIVTILLSVVFIALIPLLEDNYIFIPLIIATLFTTFLLCSTITGFIHLAFVLSSITLLVNDAGLQLVEIPFYTFSAFMAGYFLWDFLKGSLVIKNRLDWLFLCFILLIPYAVILGILNGSSIYHVFGETTYFMGLLIYFPLRKHMDREQFERILFGVVTIILLYVLIRNALNYRQLLIQATLSWEAEKARVTANESILMMGCFMCMSAASLIASKSKQLFFTLLFISFFVGLILTQSRGYWLAFLFGASIIFLSSNSKGKYRILYTALLLFALGTAFLYAFLGENIELVLKGLTDRLATIGSGKLDISLLERIMETETVLDLISKNPIAGYGFGYTFSKKILFFDHYIATSYVHNGYLAAWYKFGILGCFVTLCIWFLSFFKTRQILKKSIPLIDRIISLSALGTISGMILVNITSPQILGFENLLLLTLICAFLSSRNVKYAHTRNKYHYS